MDDIGTRIEKLAVRTTAGDIFTGDESAKLAALIFKRFGREVEPAVAAWRRMLGNNTTSADFLELVEWAET